MSASYGIIAPPQDTQRPERLFRDALDIARRPLTLQWRTVVTLVYVLAIIGDMLTTRWLLASPNFAEMNPIAQAAFSAVGQMTYLAITAFVQAIVVAPALLFHPRSSAARAVQITAILLATTKVFVVLHNGFVGGWL